MIERMLASGGVIIGESYEVQENGKTLTVRSIGPARESSQPKKDKAQDCQRETAGSQSRVSDSRGN